MDEHDGGSPLQLCEDRIEAGVSQVTAAGVRDYRHAVELEHVERVGDLVQRPFDVGQRQRRECPEPVRTVALEVCEVLVDPAREGPCRRIVAEVHAGVLIDGTATSICASSRYAIAASRLHRGGVMPPAAFPPSFEASQ